MVQTKYIKIKLGEPNEGKEIFVRENDFKEMQKSLKGKNPNKIVKSVINVLLGSPDGMNDLVHSLGAFSFIQECNSIGALESFRDLINYEIRKLKVKNNISVLSQRAKKEKEKARKFNNKTKKIVKEARRLFF
jgi:hypothetical protein